MCSGDRSVPCVARQLIRLPDYLWVYDSSSMFLYDDCLLLCLCDCCCVTDGVICCVSDGNCCGAVVL